MISRISDTISVLSDDIDSIPYTVGWTRAAIAIHSVGSIESPIFIRLTADDHSPLLIDFRYHAFAWRPELADFPAEPIEVRVQTEATTFAAPPLFEMPGHDLDELLWLIGYHSFAGLPASWLPLGQRYKLLRWPNLRPRSQTLNQMRMTAMLGNVSLTAAELAIAADVHEIEAQRLINAFSLMAIVQGSDDQLAAVADAARAAVGELAG